MLLYLGLVWMWKETLEVYLMFPGYVDRPRKNVIFSTGQMTLSGLASLVYQRVQRRFLVKGPVLIGCTNSFT